MYSYASCFQFKIIFPENQFAKQTSESVASYKMSIVFSELTTHSQRIAMFQSNYDCLKQMRNPVSCKSIQKCGVINAFQVSKLLSAYRTKMLTPKQETDGKDGSERTKSTRGKPFLIEKSSSGDSHSTILISPNSNFENLSDDALSHLFASELEKSNKDKEVIRETLSHLSVGSEITLDPAIINLGNDGQWRKLDEHPTGNDASHLDELEYDISAGRKTNLVGIGKNDMPMIKTV